MFFLNIQIEQKVITLGQWTIFTKQTTHKKRKKKFLGESNKNLQLKVIRRKMQNPFMTFESLRESWKYLKLLEQKFTTRFRDGKI